MSHISQISPAVLEDMDQFQLIRINCFGGARGQTH